MMRYQKLCPQKGKLWGRYLCQGPKTGLRPDIFGLRLCTSEDNVEEQLIVSW